MSTDPNAHDDPPAPSDGRAPFGGRAIPALLLAAFAIQGVAAALEDSVTIDEYIHVPLGVHLLDTGDASPDLMNPPLGKAVAAFPLVFWNDAFTSLRGAPAGSLGWSFLVANRDRYQAVFVACRLMILAFALLLGLLVHAWAKRLYGPRAGMAALVLFAFSSDLLAHGHLATLDLLGAFTFVLSCWAAWRLLERPGPWRALWAGAALGVAILTKLSGIVLVAVLLGAALAGAIRDRRPLAWLGYTIAACAVALVLLNAGYGFQGTGTPLADAGLAAGGPVGALARAMPWLPLPVPVPLLHGLGFATTSGDVPEPMYFLAGELSAKGWWYYHLAAFGLKTSLPLLFLAVGALAMAFRDPRRRMGELLVFGPVAVLFLAASLAHAPQIGVRHVLAEVPLLIVPASGLAASWLWRPASRGFRRWAPAALTVALLSWHVGGTVAVAPRYLQFFNEIAGGPANGHRVLTDSNLDWGQDLIRLKDWLDQHPTQEELHLATFGRVDPAIYGIRALPLDRDSHGLAVVSASMLAGRPYFGNLEGHRGWIPAGTYAWLQGMPPIDRVGALFVYRLP